MGYASRMLSVSGAAPSRCIRSTKYHVFDAIEMKAMIDGWRMALSRGSVDEEEEGDREEASRLWD